MELERAVHRAVRLLRCLSEAATLPDEAWLPAFYLATVAGHVQRVADDLDEALSKTLPKTAEERGHGTGI